MGGKFCFHGRREKLQSNQVELWVLGVQDVVTEQFDHVEPLVTALAKDTVIKVVAVDINNRLVPAVVLFEIIGLATL